VKRTSQLCRVFVFMGPVEKRPEFLGSRSTLGVSGCRMCLQRSGLALSVSCRWPNAVHDVVLLDFEKEASMLNSSFFLLAED
jgi:hypothetical protein